jgi:NitT/TauT family transport system permease protein
MTFDTQLNTQASLDRRNSSRSSNEDALANSSSAPQPTSNKKSLTGRPELWMIPSVFVLGILVWEFGVPLLGIQDFILPRPSQILTSLITLLQDPGFWHHFVITTQETLLGFTIGVVVAISLGTAVAQVPLLEKTLMPYVIAFQSVPKIALAPLFVLWFGYGLTSKVVMAAVIAFFPMLINVIEGLRSADADRIQMLRAFGANKVQIFRLVRFPSALPFLFAGFEIGIIFAILGAIVGEFIGAQEGLGYLLLQMNFNFDIAGMFAVLVVLSAMGLFAHLVLQLIRRRFAFWSKENQVIGA